MDRNFIDVESDNSNIKPLDNNTSNNSNNIQEIKPGTDKNNLSNNDDDFVKSLPDWDLLPPYDMIRRVTR